MISIGASEIEEKNCSEDCNNAESELCLGHNGNMRGQCVCKVKNSNSRASRDSRAWSKAAKKKKSLAFQRPSRAGQL